MAMFLWLAPKSIPIREFKQSFLGLLDSGLTQGANFLISILIGRFLGAAVFGDYSGTVRLCGIIGVIASFGVQAVVGREIARRPGKIGLYLGQAVAIRLAFSIPLTVAISTVVALLTINYDKLNHSYTPVIALHAGTLSLLMLYYQAYLSMREVRPWLIRNSLFKAATLVVASGVLMYSADFYWLLAGWVALGAAAVVNHHHSLERIYGKIPLQLDRRFTPRLILKSLPLSFAGLAEYCSLYADTVLLLMLRSSAEAGIYSVGAQIYLVASLVPITAAKVFIPSFTQMYYADTSQAFKLLANRAALYLVLSIICAVGMVYVAGPLVEPVYGKEFYEVVAVLGGLAFALPFLALNRLGIYALIACRKNIYYAYVSGVAATVNLAVNFVVIPLYGWKGAMATTILTEAAVLSLVAIRLVLLWRKGQ